MPLVFGDECLAAYCGPVIGNEKGYKAVSRFYYSAVFFKKYSFNNYRALLRIYIPEFCVFFSVNSSAHYAVSFCRQLLFSAASAALTVSSDLAFSSCLCAGFCSAFGFLPQVLGMFPHRLLYIPGFTFLKAPFLLMVKSLIVLKLHFYIDAESVPEHASELRRSPEIKLLGCHIAQRVYGKSVSVKLKVFLVYSLGDSHE